VVGDKHFPYVTLELQYVCIEYYMPYWSYLTAGYSIFITMWIAFQRCKHTQAPSVAAK